MHITPEEFEAFQRRHRPPQGSAAPKIVHRNPQRKKQNLPYVIPPGRWGSVADGMIFMPLPVSTNLTYTDVIVSGTKKDGTKFNRTQRLLTKAAWTYKRIATGLAMASGLPQIKGKVKLTLHVWGRGQCDLMNLEKILVDSLKNVLFEDDHRICDFRIRDTYPMLDGTASGVAVQVEPFVASLPPTGHLFTEVD